MLCLPFFIRPYSLFPSLNVIIYGRSQLPVKVKLNIQNSTKHPAISLAISDAALGRICVLHKKSIKQNYRSINKKREINLNC